VIWCREPLHQRD